jgi:two-component system sensor histidine kinase DegS
MSLAEETAIYWIVQESISNIRKHSNATEVVVKIHTYDGGIKIIICDNGIGFKTDVILNSSLMLEHMGLVGMQERAKLIGGSMNVDSTPGAGTSVILSIPVLSKQLTEIIL